MQLLGYPMRQGIVKHCFGQDQDTERSDDSFFFHLSSHAESTISECAERIIKALGFDK